MASTILESREQTLMGNTVKVDNLAIFKVSCIGNGCTKLYDADTDKTISASIGVVKKTDKTGPAVGSLKLLAQATGEYTREELNKDGRLSWTDKAAEQILTAKGGSSNAPSGSLTPSPSPTGEGSGNTGGGGDNGGGGDDDNPNEN